MQRKKGFIGLAFLQICILFTAGALWWSYSVDHTLIIAIERKKWHTMRYAVEYVARMAAKNIYSLNNDLLDKKYYQGTFTWLSQHRQYFYNTTIIIEPVEELSGVIITTTLQHHATTITLKGLLHENIDKTALVFDHYTFSPSV